MGHSRQIIGLVASVATLLAMGVAVSANALRDASESTAPNASAVAPSHESPQPRTAPTGAPNAAAPVDAETKSASDVDKLFAASGVCDKLAMVKIKTKSSDVGRGINVEPFGKPVLDWSDDDIDAAVRVYGSVWPSVTIKNENLLKQFLS